MKNIDIVLKQIKADKHNIQQMIDRMPLCETKGELRTLMAVINLLVKEVHNQKVIVDDKMFSSTDSVAIPLFEVEPSPVSDFEAYRDMSSYLGNLDV